MGDARTAPPWDESCMVGFATTTWLAGALAGLGGASVCHVRRPRTARIPRARRVAVPEVNHAPAAAADDEEQARTLPDDGRDPGTELADVPLVDADATADQSFECSVDPNSAAIDQSFPRTEDVDSDSVHGESLGLPYEQAERGSTPDDKLRLKGRESEELGKLTDAKALYQACTKMNKHNGKGWQDLAKIEARLSNSLFAAIDIIDEALTYNYKNPFLWQTLGLLHSRTKNLTKARHCFQTGLDVDKMHAPLYSAWGRVEAVHGNIVEARAIFERGARLGLECVRMYHTWGVMESKFGSLERALELFDKGLEVEPENEYVWQSVGNIAMIQGNYERARFCFQRALRNEAENVVVLEAWGRLETKHGHFNDARDLFRRAEEACEGTDARLFQSWSVLESIDGNHSVALRLAERALRLKPHDSILWHRVGSCEADLGNFPKARALFKKGASCNPRDWRLWDTWSTMEWRCGNREISTKLSERSFAVRYNVKGEFVLLASGVNDRKHHDLLNNLVRRRGARSNWALRRDSNGRSSKPSHRQKDRD